MTATKPWPIDAWYVLPIVHSSSKVRTFHSGLGMIPVASPGRSMPVLLPKPSSLPYL